MFLEDSSLFMGKACVVSAAPSCVDLIHWKTDTQFGAGLVLVRTRTPCWPGVKWRNTEASNTAVELAVSCLALGLRFIFVDVIM